MANNVLKDNNELPANELFKYRENFKDIIEISYIPRFSPMVRSKFDRPFYLRKDKKGNSIFLSESFLKEILPKGNSPILVHDFIRDAFYDMSVYFAKGLNTGRLKRSGSPYSTLTPSIGFIAHQRDYIAFLNSFNKSFLNYLSIQNLQKKILTFEKFVEYFFYYFKNKEEKVFTRSKFLETTKNSIFTTGVSLSLDNGDFSNDFEKIKKYVGDNNFPFFLETCRRFGFFVDKDAPWVIHYDFNSPATELYLKKYNLANVDDVIEKRYYKAYISDVEIAKGFLISLYNNFYNLENRVDFVIDINKCNIPIVKTVEKEVITENGINTKYSNFYWLKFYLDLKILEENIKIVESKYNIVLKNINSVLEYGFSPNATEQDRFFNALDYLNSFVLESKELVDFNKLKEF